MRIHDRPFIGSEAVEAGALKKYELRTRYRAVFPDVYLSIDFELTLRQRAVAGWLWSHREGVISGLTASALHGAKWIDDWLPVELVWPNARPPRGLCTSDYRLLSGEFIELDGLCVTSVERTAFDIGRRGRLDEAVAHLDALGNATGFVKHDVLAVADRHPGTRGLRKLGAAIDLYDPGAASPRETRWRLLLIRAGFPRPRTQISVRSASGRHYYIDMGWEDLKVAVEYDGDQHRVDRPQFAKDIIRLEELRDLGWIIVRVVAESREADVIERLRRAWDSRLR